MDGFTVSKSDRFLDRSSLSINGGSSNTSTASELKSFPQPETPNTSFAETLNTAIGNVNELQKSSDKAMQNLATGRTDNIADVMVAAEKADLALRLMVQVRNKIIDAYQEVMKMQV